MLLGARNLQELLTNKVSNSDIKVVDYSLAQFRYIIAENADLATDKASKPRYCGSDLSKNSQLFELCSNF